MDVKRKLNYDDNKRNLLQLSMIINKSQLKSGVNKRFMKQVSSQTLFVKVKHIIRRVFWIKILDKENPTNNPALLILRL